jgi:hypothetical protein
MMRAILNSHPTTPCPAITRFEVDVANSREALELTYRVSGDISALKVPPPAASAFADGLWKHTCFEVFVGSAVESGYYEFNFSPSGAWAAYRFSDYRAQMTPVAHWQAPAIRVSHENREFELASRIPLGELSLPPRALLAITAVIERNDGTLSYWSLEHSAGKPDFHRKEGFVLPLRAQ